MDIRAAVDRAAMWASVEHSMSVTSASRAVPARRYQKPAAQMQATRVTDRCLNGRNLSARKPGDDGSADDQPRLTARSVGHPNLSRNRRLTPASVVRILVGHLLGRPKAPDEHHQYS
jgi:hypothetical protein